MNAQKRKFQTLTLLGVSSILHMYLTVCKRVIHQKAIFIFHLHALLLYAYVYVDVCMSLDFSPTVFLDVVSKSVLPSVQSFCIQYDCLKVHLFNKLH